MKMKNTNKNTHKNRKHKIKRRRTFKGGEVNVIDLLSRNTTNSDFNLDKMCNELIYSAEEGYFSRNQAGKTKCERVLLSSMAKVSVYTMLYESYSEAFKAIRESHSMTEEEFTECFNSRCDNVKIIKSNSGNPKCISSFNVKTTTPRTINQIVLDLNGFEKNEENSMDTQFVPTTNPGIFVPTQSSYNFDDVNITFDTSAPYPDIEICGDDEQCKKYVNYYKNEMKINDSEDYIRKSEIIPGITDNEKYMGPCRATSEPIDYCKSKNVSPTMNPNLLVISNSATTQQMDSNTNISTRTTADLKTSVPTKTSDEGEEEGNEEVEGEEGEDSLDDLLGKLSDKFSDASSNVSDKMQKLVDYLSKEEEISTPRPNTSIGDTKGMNPGKDMYSYFGALPNKGESNFIPVNSDFSAFRR
jgi:hypothetical protein